jgi:hypothetical protein
MVDGWIIQLTAVGSYHTPLAMPNPFSLHLERGLNCGLSPFSFHLEKGLNCGLSVFALMQNWTRDLISLAVKARSIKSSKYAVFKKTLREVYTANPTQIYITSVIICNFCLVAAESQIQPAKGTLTARNFATMDYFFSFLFLMDLEVNILAHWFWPFVRNPWNVFGEFQTQPPTTLSANFRLYPLDKRCSTFLPLHQVLSVPAVVL